MAAEAATAWEQASQALTDLGGTIVQAASSLLAKVAAAGAAQDPTTVAAALGSMTADDMEAVVGQVVEKVTKGITQITDDAAGAMLDKLQGESGWGKIEDWTEARFEQAGPLVTGLDATDLGVIPDATFGKVVDDLGSKMTWPAQERKVLADKAKKAWTGGSNDMTRVTGEQLLKGPGFLSELDATDLGQIPSTAFKTATRAFADAGKAIGAYTADQQATLKTQVKQSIGSAVSQLTADNVKELDSLLGVLDSSDIATIPDAALGNIAPSAVRLMGGQKASEAFSPEKLDKLPAAAKAAFVASDLAALTKEQQKAVLGCGANVTTCNVGAVVDIAVEAVAGTKTDEQIRQEAIAAIGNQRSASTSTTTSAIDEIADSNIIIQQAATLVANSALATGRRRRRTLLAATSSTKTRTVVRVTTSSNAAAQAAQQATSAVGTPTFIPVTATDSVGASGTGTSTGTSTGSAGSGGFNGDGSLPNAKTSTTPASAENLPAIIGGAAGGAVVVGIIAIVAVLMARRNRRNSNQARQGFPGSNVVPSAGTVNLNNNPVFVPSPRSSASGPTVAVPIAAEAIDQPQLTVDSWLAARDMQGFSQGLKQLGCNNLGDLRHVVEGDLLALGMPPVQVRRFLHDAVDPSLPFQPAAEVIPQAAIVTVVDNKKETDLSSEVSSDAGGEAV
eukprot:g1092.t1